MLPGWVLRGRRLGCGHGTAPARIVQRPPSGGRGCARAADAVHAGDARGANGLHRYERTRLARLEPLPGLDPVRAGAGALRARSSRRAVAGARAARRALARLLPERAVPRHRPEVRRRRRWHTCALRRVAVLGRRVDGAAARADLALPRAHGRAPDGRNPERLGVGRRSALTELVWDLPRPRAALEFLGRRRQSRSARRAARQGPDAPGRLPAPARADRAPDVVPVDELPGALLVRPAQHTRAGLNAGRKPLSPN